MTDFTCQTSEDEAYEWLDAEEAKDPEYAEQLRRYSIWLHPKAESLIPQTAFGSACRRELADRLHSMPVNITIIALASLDALILISVMLLEIEALKLEPGERQNVLQEARFALECVSVCILTVFMIELTLKFIAVGPRHFFTQWLEVLDACVTIVSLVIDAVVIADHAIHMQNSHGASHDSGLGIGSGALDAVGAAAGLLIVFRLWRVIRIVSATVVSIYAGMERKLTEMREKRTWLERRVFQLEARLRRLHIPLPKEVQDDEGPRTHERGFKLPKLLSSKALFRAGSEVAVIEEGSSTNPDSSET
ncbi:voltage-gated hydrogen channel 1 [Clonorchis sinensis]|uniref:Voltage-gated hydrogen channel 1 n=1 Tax=Clonorchis sinensis TaxID=79923 RepID=G7Y8E9_CLOSI|nr:voltage-gated hydrogen channel 1 [Clonorchis sinensis]